MSESPEFWRFALELVTIGGLVVKHLLDVAGRRKIKTELDANTAVTRKVEQDAKKAYQEANDTNRKLELLADRPVVIQFQGGEELEEMLARCLSQCREA